MTREKYIEGPYIPYATLKEIFDTATKVILKED
jgi:hypothetical protein